MEPRTFETADGLPVPAVTAEEMADVDRVAVEEAGLGLLMMMEHAGRGLASAVQASEPEGPVTVLAGGGGNGGGGLCAARHLANHGRTVTVVLDRAPAELGGAPACQWQVLGETQAETAVEASEAVSKAAVVVDALVGYRLRGAPRDRVAELLETVNERADQVVSLDVPTGVEATSGERRGLAVTPDVTVTLALPKTGLVGLEGDLQLVDLGIPTGVYARAGLDVESPFPADRWRVSLETCG